MNKIAVFTLQGLVNYGNRLQNYAVEAALKKLGCTPSSIVMTQHPRLKPLQEWYSIEKGCRTGTPAQRLEAQRRKRFLQFNREHLCMAYCRPDQLALIDHRFEATLTGSDQVWNPAFDRDGVLLLPFSKRRICLSPSFGVSSLSESVRARYAAELKKFPLLSVRESDGAALIESLTGQRAEVLIDPTMAITREEWGAVEKKPDFLIPDSYIFTYTLGEKRLGESALAQTLSQAKGCPILNLYDNKKENTLIAGPAEFLWLIHHADFVLSDSFHAIVFSILFQRPFVAFDRVDHLEAMNSRMETLVGTFGFEARREKRVEADRAWHCDFSQSETVLARERERFSTFLRRALAAAQQGDGA